MPLGLVLSQRCVRNPCLLRAGYRWVHETYAGVTFNCSSVSFWNVSCMLRFQRLPQRVQSQQIHLHMTSHGCKYEWVGMWHFFVWLLKSNMQVSFTLLISVICRFTVPQIPAGSRFSITFIPRASPVWAVRNISSSKYPLLVANGKFDPFAIRHSRFRRFVVRAREHNRWRTGMLKLCIYRVEKVAS